MEEQYLDPGTYVITDENGVTAEVVIEQCVCFARRWGV